MAPDNKTHKKRGICIKCVAYCSEYVGMNIIKPGEKTALSPSRTALLEGPNSKNKKNQKKGFFLNGYFWKVIISGKHPLVIQAKFSHPPSLKLETLVIRSELEGGKGE